MKVPQGYSIEAVKIPLLESAAAFAGDLGAVLTRKDISTILQCGPSNGQDKDPRGQFNEHGKKRAERRRVAP
ncbi:hypothetical protein ACTGJ9_029910 [Bradyrhizobium sp. RDM12]